jgi:hypothetical protein
MPWTDSTLFLRMVVAFRTFLWPSYQVSGRTWCKHVAPSTLPNHNTTEGQTRLHCRSTLSRLSQAVTRSSGMWRQEMLPSILHGCHFDTISSFSIKNFAWIFLTRPRTCTSSRYQIACFKVAAKLYIVATRTAERRRVRTAQNSQRSNARNAVPVTWSRVARVVGEVLPWPSRMQFGDCYFCQNPMSLSVPGAVRDPVVWINLNSCWFPLCLTSSTLGQ